MTDFWRKRSGKLYLEFSSREVDACSREEELERQLLRLFGGLSQIVSDRNSIYLYGNKASYTSVPLEFYKEFRPVAGKTAD